MCTVTYFNIFGRLRHNLLKLLGINTLDSCSDQNCMTNMYHLIEHIFIVMLQTFDNIIVLKTIFRKKSEVKYKIKFNRVRINPLIYFIKFFIHDDRRIICF